MKSLSSVNGDVSVTSVKEEIKRIIESEPKEKPYSDQKIVEILQKKGIKIARRTVAKYREELSIPSTSQRRKLRR
jgi:RNA polymerase sigma-54 factor